MHELPVALVGVLIGLVFGAFGVGGAAIATPVLALLGLPAVVAVASPLPAMVPSALVGARQYQRSGHLDRRAATVAVVAGVPAVVLGALASSAVDGPVLVAASTVLLLLAGLRLVVPSGTARGPRTVPSGVEGPPVPGVTRARRATVVALVVSAAFLSGLLANGGGALLVPILAVGLGLGMARATGTSMVVVAFLVLPTVVVHWSLGHIDWAVAAAFACGALPATLVGTRVGRNLADGVARRALGVLLVAVSVVIVVTRIAYM